MATAALAGLSGGEWQDGSLSALSRAVSLHLQGHPAEALAELAASGDRGLETAATMGHICFEIDRYQEAGEHYRRVLSLDPDNLTARFSLGVCLEKCAQMEEAAECFAAVLKEEPSRTEARLGLAVCQLQQDQSEAALENFDRCLLSDPGNRTAMFGRAVALQLTWRFDDAVEAYEQLLARDPDSLEALLNLVSLGVARNDRSLIRSASDRLLRRDPDSQGALEGLAACAFAEGDWTTALVMCERLLKTAAETWERWFNLGIAQSRLGRSDDAMESWRNAIRLRPDCRQAWVNLGATRQEMGDLRGAREAYEHALSFSPDLPEVLYNLATICEQQGARDEAERLYGRIAAQRGDSAEDAWFRLGYLRLQKGDFRGGVEAFSSCLRKRPDWVEAAVNLAISHWRQGDRDAAGRAFEAALAVDAGAVEALRGLAALCAEKEDFDRALELQTKLVEAGNPSPELLYNTGVLHQRAGRMREAGAFYEQAIEQRAEFAEAHLNLGHVWKAKGDIVKARECWNLAVQLKPDLARDHFPG